MTLINTDSCSLFYVLLHYIILQQEEETIVWVIEVKTQGNTTKKQTKPIDVMCNGAHYGCDERDEFLQVWRGCPNVWRAHISSWQARKRHMAGCTEKVDVHTVLRSRFI